MAYVARIILNTGLPNQQLRKQMVWFKEQMEPLKTIQLKELNVKIPFQAIEKWFEMKPEIFL